MASKTNELSRTPSPTSYSATPVAITLPADAKTSDVFERKLPQLIEQWENYLGSLSKEHKAIADFLTSLKPLSLPEKYERYQKEGAELALRTVFQLDERSLTRDVTECGKLFFKYIKNEFPLPRGNLLTKIYHQISTGKRESPFRPLHSIFALYVKRNEVGVFHDAILEFNQREARIAAGKETLSPEELKERKSTVEIEEWLAAVDKLRFATSDQNTNRQEAYKTYLQEANNSEAKTKFEERNGAFLAPTANPLDVTNLSTFNTFLYLMQTTHFSLADLFGSKDFDPNIQICDSPFLHYYVKYIQNWAESSTTSAQKYYDLSDIAKNRKLYPKLPQKPTLPLELDRALCEALLPDAKEIGLNPFPKVYTAQEILETLDILLQRDDLNLNARDKQDRTALTFACDLQFTDAQERIKKACKARGIALLDG